MGMKNRRSQKSPPILSHEFIIQNHADIVSCFAMVFVVGLMFQVTAPLASLFVAVNHNASAEPADDQPRGPAQILYSYGLKDISCIFFYFLICIIVHAVVQEYVIDRMNRKLHLSKVNHRKFNESGQLLAFFVVSVFWGANIMYKDGLIFDLAGLWTNYPEAHAKMTFQHKFFFIIQIAYWLHQFPELYFQKIKKDEMFNRIQVAVIYLAVILAAYILNFTKLALALLVVHYASECVFLAARILHFAAKPALAKRAFFVRNVTFVPVRLSAIVASVLTFYFGLAKEKQGWDLATGNFNTQVFRISCLVGIALLQAWMLWNFMTFHLRKRRERAQATQSQKKKQSNKPKKQTVVKPPADDDVNELPEVDQNTSKDLRQRKVPVK